MQAIIEDQHNMSCNSTNINWFGWNSPPNVLPNTLCYAVGGWVGTSGEGGEVRPGRRQSTERQEVCLPCLQYFPGFISLHKTKDWK